jgi:hypothetical protein
MRNKINVSTGVNTPTMSLYRTSEIYAAFHVMTVNATLSMSIAIVSHS